MILLLKRVHVSAGRSFPVAGLGPDIRQGGAPDLILTLQYFYVVLHIILAIYMFK